MSDEGSGIIFSIYSLDFSESSACLKNFGRIRKKKNVPRFRNEVLTMVDRQSVVGNQIKAGQNCSDKRSGCINSHKPVRGSESLL